MKKRLKLFWGILFLMLCISFASIGIKSFNLGYKEGVALAKDNELTLWNNSSIPLNISIVKDSHSQKEMIDTTVDTEKLYMAKFGVWVLIILLETLIVTLIFALANSVRHLAVFTNSNVLFLRGIGGILLLVALSVTGLNYIDYRIGATQINIEGFSLVAQNIFDFYNFLLGLFILLIAEVFSIGIKMKEEQDLTV